MAVLRCGRARFARGDRSEAAAVVPLDMPGFLRSGKNFFPRRHYVRGFHTLYYEGFWRRIILYTKRSFIKFFYSLAIQQLLGVWQDKLFTTVWQFNSFWGFGETSFFPRVRMKTGSRIRYNAKRRHWRRTKLKL
ncbi:unnamed protein product [Meloidogyne enterolobii]|uniref:Uncharacterized protein n=1 Tax=Meloidogyne enterolobii TaxID=390850 RepID=A0ACB1AG30_MELEN